MSLLGQPGSGIANRFPIRYFFPSIHFDTIAQ